MSQHVAKDFRKVNKPEAAVEFLADKRRESAALRERQTELLAHVARVKKSGSWVQRDTVPQVSPGRIGYSEVSMQFKGTHFISVEGTPYSVALQERIGNRESLVSHTHLLVHIPTNEASSTLGEADIHSFAIFEPSSVRIDGLDSPTVEALDSIQELIDYIEASPEK